MQHDPDFEILVNEIRPQIKELSVTQVQQKFAAGEKFIFIDVREDKSAEIVLYCGGGFRSALAAYNLQKMGYRNVSSMDGGIREWKERSLPIQK